MIACAKHEKWTRSSASPVRRSGCADRIIACVKHGRWKDALDLYNRAVSKQDPSSSPPPPPPSSHLPAPVYVALLRACAFLRDLHQGVKLHRDISTTGLLAHDLFIGSTLLFMYAKCGSFTRAEQVFHSLPVQNVVSWNALIRGCAEHGRGKEALHHFDLMRIHGISPDAFTFSSIFKAIGMQREIGKGEEVHSEIARRGFLGRNVVVESSVVDMYAKCGKLQRAHEVFDGLSARDAVAWTSLIGGYAENGHGKQALKLLERMQSENVRLDAATFVCCFKACGCIGAFDKGQEMHSEAARSKLLDSNKIVGSALLDMYVEWGSISKAQEVFDQLPVKNVVSWSTLITGYVEHGYGVEALQLFEQMRSEGTSPNSVTFVSSLRACIMVQDIQMGQTIHAHIGRSGLFERDDAIGNCLVDMYAKFGLLAKAQAVFNKLPVQNVISWNALIAGYAECGHGETAIECFGKMKLKGVSPDSITFVCILKACGNIGAKSKGIEIHSEISRIGLLENDLVLANSLLDMYAKCGVLGAAHQVFSKLPIFDIFSCNSLMAGYSQLGDSEQVFSIFDRMLRENIKPGWITFLIVLNTCSRSGLFNKSKMYMEAMMEICGLVLTPEHHACIVSMLCHVGELDKAITVIQKMPIAPRPITWYSILDACRHWGNLQLGKQAFNNAVCFSD